jgi:hypothetical protein
MWSSFRAGTKLCRFLQYLPIFAFMFYRAKKKFQDTYPDCVAIKFPDEAPPTSPSSSSIPLRQFQQMVPPGLAFSYPTPSSSAGMQNPSPVRDPAMGMAISVVPGSPQRCIQVGASKPFTIKA